MMQARIGVAVAASLIFFALTSGSSAQFWPFSSGAKPPAQSERPPAPAPKRKKAPAPAAETAPAPEPAASADDSARFLAGLAPAADSPLAPLTQGSGWQQHANALNASFGNFDKRQGSKILAWSKANLKAPKPVLFYMFSGPDFLYANAFFPDATTYVLAGLEPVGQIPDLARMPRGAIPGALASVRSSMRSVLQLSFFITKQMKSELHGGRLSGTLPVLYVFLARSGKTIKEVSLVHLDEQGELKTGDGSGTKTTSRGAKIVFAGSDGREGTLYYFSTNLANDGFRKGFAQFCEKLGDGDAFLKSASYLPHSGNFTQVRNFLLDHSVSIVQDDTGIPVTYFDPKKWQLQAFGRYAGPIAIFPGHYQPKLADLHRKGHAPAIDFGIGYKWRTNESGLLLAVRSDAGLRQ
jgi:hypothetical protein